MINKRKKNTKLSLVFLILFLLIILMYISFNNKNINRIRIYFNSIGNKIRNYLLIKNTIDQEITLGINKELEDENNKLKELLEIKENNYDMITSIVLKRDVLWYSNLTINKGFKDGINKNMAVIDNNGLIGKIIEVSDNYSKVLLITDSNNKVAVSVNGYYGILTSYNKNIITVKNIDKENDIKIGDKVYTNGLGGVYPSGIYVGSVKEILSDDNELSTVVKIERKNTFDNIRYVNVIRR